MAVEGMTAGTASGKAGFDHYWRQQGAWVEEPNVRRGGESGVQRLFAADGQMIYVKRQVGHIYRSWLHPFGRPTVLRERDALTALYQLDVNVPKMIFCGTQRDENNDWQALLVTKSLDGFEEFEHWLQGGGRERHGEAVYEQVLQSLATNLARMHRGRWQHSCIYIKHVFVRVTGEGSNARGEVALLDLEKCRQRMTAQQAASHDMKQLRRHSSFSDPDWRKLIYLYEAAFGSSIKGLR